MTPSPSTCIPFESEGSHFLAVMTQHSSQLCIKISHALIGRNARLQLSDGPLNAAPVICSAQLAVEGKAVQGPFLAAELSLQLGSPQPSCMPTATLRNS